MNGRRITPLMLVLVLLLCAPGVVSAAPDRVQERLLEQFALPLRWDNVEGAEFWVEGASPAYAKASGWHLVTLEPGAEVRVRLPEGEQLRVVRPVGELAPTDLEAFVSNGSGLFASQALQGSADGRSLLLTPDPGGPAVVRLARPAASRESLEVALFVSRREPLGEIAPYRRLRSLPGESARLRTRHQATALDFWLLAPEKPLEVELQGPARLAVEHRLAYPPAESDQRLGYRLSARFDDGSAQVLDVAATAETSEPLWLDGRQATLGRREVGYLEIPAGRRTLRLDATAPLYLRLLEQEAPDYLLPALNAPAPGAAEVRAEPLPEPLRRAWTQLADGDIRGLEQASPQRGDLLERLALRTARDNRRREGGLSGAGLLGRAAARRPDHPELGTAADRLLGSHSFFRDLVPASRSQGGPQQFAWVVVRSLRDPGERRGEGVLGEQHLEAGLDQLVGGFFVPVPRRGAAERATLQRTPENRLEIALPGDLLFDTDRAELRPEVREALTELANYLKNRTRGEIRVTGHTDSRAPEAYNQDLSERRAASVALFLTRQGLSPIRLRIAGKGESEPRAGNDSAEGMQLNRRVEIDFEVAAPAPVPQADPAQVYLLPPSEAAGALRLLAFRRGEPARSAFWLQLDDQPPIRFELDTRTGLPETEFHRSTAETALEVLAVRHAGIDAGTLGGPFAVRREPAPRRAAASWQLPLAAGSSRVRVWREEAEADEVFLALQYRAAKPYQLSESGFLEMLRRTSPESLLQRLGRLLQGGAAWEALPPAGAELDNHLLPLVRWLQGRARGFAAGLSPPAAAAAAPLDEAQRQQLRLEAQAAERAGEWLPALEQWSRLVQGLPATAAAERREAHLQQVEALGGLGEGYLAERLLRALLLHDGDPQLRQEAFARLEREYRRNGDSAGLQALLAHAIVTAPEPGRLAELAATLADAGEYPLALAAGLAAGGEQVSSTLLRACFQLSWWRSFEQLLGELPEDQRHYWQALRELEMGEYAAARGHLRQAGAPGRELERLLLDGLAIHGRLRSADPVVREAALLDWELWQEQQPGPFTWREAGGLVADYPGAATLYAIDTDRYFRAYRSAPGQPVRLRLAGPLRLRIEARPLHPAGGTIPFDGWLRLRDAEGLQLLPISNNLPSPGLAVAGEPDQAAGVLAEGEFAFGPGVHEVEVASEEGPVLVRFFARRPEIPLPVLPPLTPATLVAAAAGWPPQEESLADPQQVFAAARLLSERLQARRPERPAQPPAAARALAEARIDEVLALSESGQGEQALVRRLTLLLWLAERSPQRRGEALAKGEALVQGAPRSPEIASLLARLGRDSRWEPVTTVSSSAGLRYLPLAGWQPESPHLRVRRALLAPLDEGEQLVYGGSSLVVGMLNLQPGRVRLELAAEEAALHPLAPLVAEVCLDDQAPRRLTLDAGKPTEVLDLQVPAGRHGLRVAVEAPLANQYLRVRVLEEQAGHYRPLLQLLERPWQVATAAEPLRLLVPGPAWLRIDELQQGQQLVSYRYVDAGWQELVLVPGAGQRERLLRIHQKLAAGEAPSEEGRPPLVTAVPLPGPLLRLEAPGKPPRVHFSDAYPLGGQEDGTWSRYLSLVRRRNVQEDVDLSGNPEQFAEFGATHRYYASQRRTWFKTDFLARLREEGGPTLGLRERIVHRPEALPVTLRFDGSAFLQRPGGIPLDPTGGGRTDWALGLRGAISQRREITPKTHHLPELFLFARYLSRDRSPAREADRERLDQDVFTPYKADHRWGWGLGETLVHQPWLDTRWYAGFTLTSNEDLNPLRPDHLRYRLGWQQLLGDFDLEAGYAASWYFDDGDRAANFTRDQLFLELGWDWWFYRQHRLELRLRLTRDLDRSENLGMLSLLWHGGNGRGYRDFWPGEVDFSGLRERRAATWKNNRIDDAQGD